MSLLNRTSPTRSTTTREAPAPVAQPRPLLGGGYITTPTPRTPTEGTYITTHNGGPIQARGTYVTTSNQSISDRSEGRYTDRG